MIFMIWTETKLGLLVFIENLNSNHKTIKTVYNISHNNISFLETLMCKDKNNTLQTTSFQKPSDQQSYLHKHSDYPKPLRKNIPCSQALRIKTICSTLTKYKKKKTLCNAEIEIHGNRIHRKHLESSNR